MVKAILIKIMKQ